MQPAVLLLAYNRASLVRNQLELLLGKNYCRHLYIALDGPKATSADQGRVSDVLRVIKEYQKKYPKKITFSAAAENLGCQRGVERGITWFFDHEELGIILEDDCVPHPDFFEYASTLLMKYQDDHRVGMIAGTNPCIHTPTDDSYFFSHHSIIWGWATWRRAWVRYHEVKNQAPQFLSKPEIRRALTNLTSMKHLQVMEAVVNGRIDTWDYIWYLTNLVESRYCIIPSHNLVANRGFANLATHTKLKTSQADLPTFPLARPIVHPTTFLAHPDFDRQYVQMIQPWRVLLSIAQAYLRR